MAKATVVLFSASAGIVVGLIIMTLLVGRTDAGVTEAPTLPVSRTPMVDSGDAARVQRDLELVGRFLEDNHQDASWYPAIVSLRPFGRTQALEVLTVLDHDDPADAALAARVCGVTFGALIALDMPFTGVRTAARDGRSFSVKTSLADSC